jgi:hypothetical protein
VIIRCRQFIVHCKELRIRRGPVRIQPRASVGFGVASHHSGA